MYFAAGVRLFQQVLHGCCYGLLSAFGDIPEMKHDIIGKPSPFQPIFMDMCVSSAVGNSKKVLAAENVDSTGKINFSMNRVPVGMEPF